MKLDYLRDGSDDCLLIRLYEFRTTEVQRLRQAFADLASGAIEQVALPQVTPFVSVDGTHLTFRRGVRNRGITATDQHMFDMVLASEGWQRCVDLVGPFCKRSWGYQWLCDEVGRISLLLSHDGSW